MPNFNLYLSCFALLLALYWNSSMGTPVRVPLNQSTKNCTQFPLLSKTLLKNLQDLLNSRELFDFPCSSLAIEVNKKTQTVQACAPDMAQESGCSVYRNSAFNETECLGNIQADLKHYSTALQSYIDSQSHHSESAKNNLTTALETTKNLLKNCFLIPTTEIDEQEADMWDQESFYNRRHLCKVMRGFHIRVITINRAFCYISSGDHTK